MTDISREFITKDVLLSIVEFLHDNEDYLDYGLGYAPGLVFYGASMLRESSRHGWMIGRPWPRSRL